MVAPFVLVTRQRQGAWPAAGPDWSGTQAIMIETDILRAELERLYELPDLLSLSRDVLGFEPSSVGGTAAKASFAFALTLQGLRP